ncbi:MAG TPA: hypothetical protein IAA30_05495 [Candidatus Treponema faecavium]|nr:hypothetical protein [Candidatus Treponema faecavium]
MKRNTLLAKAASVCLLFILAAGALGAESYVGVKGIFKTNLGSELAETGSHDVTVLGGGGALYAGFDFLFFLGLHTEIGITAPNGVKTDTTQFTFTTVDVPVCLTARIPLGPLHVMALFGPNFSFPIGDVKTAFSSVSSDNITTKCILGLTGGIEAGFKLGPGSIVLGVRYTWDMQDFELNDRELFTRRSFDVTAGYEFRF